MTGLGETGAALCRAGVDKLAFTGSAPTGRKVMAACAETLTPVLMELGGKDAMIVDDDADVVAAADAARLGRDEQRRADLHRHRAGLRHQAVYDRFVAEVTAQAAGCAPARTTTASYGPMTMAAQTDVVRRHLDDGARRPVARVVTGGEATSTAGLRRPHRAARRARGLRRDPRGDLRPDADHHPGARRRGGAAAAPTRRRYGLAGSVFSGSRARGHGPRPPDAQRHDRRSTRCSTFASVPALPFGGVGDSGFGRIHGEDGLKEFTRAKAITRAAVRAAGAADELPAQPRPDRPLGDRRAPGARAPLGDRRELEVVAAGLELELDGAADGLDDLTRAERLSSPATTCHGAPRSVGALEHLLDGRLVLRALARGCASPRR